MLLWLVWCGVGQFNPVSIPNFDISRYLVLEFRQLRDERVSQARLSIINAQVDGAVPHVPARNTTCHDAHQYPATDEILWLFAF